MTKKAWAGRFDKKENPLMESFNASIHVDKRLFEHDITGSIAHAKMLKKIGVLNAPELARMTRGLERVRYEIRQGQFPFSDAQEDIHMAVESRLHDLIGPLAGKLHTARSRNDQVALDTRLYTRELTQNVLEKIRRLQSAIVRCADKFSEVILPGYTHLQRAQPILLAHHLLAYYEMLERDTDRFVGNLARLDQCPLGAGALAGTTLPIDRAFTAKELGFSEPTRNSLDTVADRDFILDFLSGASILMMHLSRLSEELVLWNSQEFGFVQLPEDFCTGSSMMPQKVNPDAPELIRGKTGRVYGDLITVLTLMKALPLAYNKDMQEDKAPLFDAADTVQACLDVLIHVFPGLRFHDARMKEATKQGFVLATDMADYLVKKGLPFREAHEVMGKLVRFSLSQECGLEDLSLEVLKRHCPLFDKDVIPALTLSHSVNSRLSMGGTASSSVRRELNRAQKRLASPKK